MLINALLDGLYPSFAVLQKPLLLADFLVLGINQLVLSLQFVQQFFFLTPGGIERLTHLGDLFLDASQALLQGGFVIAVLHR